MQTGMPRAWAPPLHRCGFLPRSRQMKKAPPKKQPAAQQKQQQPPQPGFGNGRIGQRERQYAPSLYDSASVWRRLTFAWISDLVARGYAAQLEEADLPDLPQGEKAAGVAALAQEHWRQELATGDPKLARALRRIVQRDCCTAALAELIKVSLQFCGPVITNVLVRARARA